MNGGIYSTGNEIVDENAKLNISGNIIPQVWYRTIIRESGKPNLTAIIILADIVYWYKPTEIRDEGTGQVIGVRKKFKSDFPTIIYRMNIRWICTTLKLGACIKRNISNLKSKKHIHIIVNFCEN